MFLQQACVAALLMGSPLADTSAAAQQPMSERHVNEIVQAIRSIRTELEQQRSFPEIQQIRDAQKQFLRANSKFPDFIEVGTDIWLRVYDWHVRWQLPVTLGRDPAGRYTLTLLGTSVIMRTDAQADFVGLPYDNR